MLAPRVRGRRLTRGDRVRGATEGEYALMLAIVIAVIVVLVAALGRQVVPKASGAMPGPGEV